MFNYRKINGSKRKVSRGLSIDTCGPSTLDKHENVDLEAIVKRRRLSQGGQQDALMETDSEWPDLQLDHNTTRPLDETHQSSILETYNPPEDPNEPMTAGSYQPATATMDAKKYSKFAWDLCMRSGLTHISPPTSPTSSSVNEITPPNTAVEMTSSASTTLSQDEIRRNYWEFVQRNQRKAAEKDYYLKTVPGFDGVVSPTDENDQNFERIFMESSDVDDIEDWEDDTVMEIL